MALSLTEKAYELWDAWGIRGLMIGSFFLQVILILFAPKRKVGGCIVIIWLAYFLADWFARTTIGFISDDSNRFTSDGPPADIMAFWAPFLLLHLGGPDNMTSYSLQDNELWQRQVLEFLLQFISTIYIFFKSFSNNELWLASGLVLFAATIKYLGRVIAFYRASFDNFGKNWVTIPKESEVNVALPKQFQGMEDHKSISGTAVLLFSNLKRILVGPLPKEKELERIIKRIGLPEKDSIMLQKSNEVLLIFEIELSLLYEVLHTKFPVMDSKTGFCFRVASFGCIVVALISFLLVNKHYQLELVDILLTYGLLTGALALDVLSFRLMKSSDWFAISHLQDGCHQHRWSETVSQLNFLTYHHVKKLGDFPYIGTLLLKAFRFQSSKNLEDQLWNFILTEIRGKHVWRKGNNDKEEKWLSEEEFEALLKRVMNPEQRKLIKELIGKLDYTQNLLVWLIATGLCFQNTDHNCLETTDRLPTHQLCRFRSMCKRLSDYMFYLAERKSTMMGGVLDNWEEEFKRTSKQMRSIVPWKFFSNEKIAAEKIWCRFKEVKVEIEEGKKRKLLCEAVELARVLKQGDGCPWEGMCKVWVQLMFFAAIRCRPTVHADQLSKGGELLTFVWLLLSHFGFGAKYRTLKEAFKERHPPPAPKEAPPRPPGPPRPPRSPA